jgi:hypothetical protein
MLLLDTSPVDLGDNVYINRANAFGQVIKLQTFSATVRVSKDGGYRDFTLQPGGMVAGEPGASWFPPINFALAKGDSLKYGKIQSVLTALVEVL